eukprot:CAMPEP_0202358996 /NCGR_PEP_ID=MMETSP1126-20121109/12449_1 /ASSEMBLY_ACC=CAM_ASM_000457 /TAXON_ID=3047 /ORGANISM="Dunaliella tertiolecta, Strain CCMP1320" /LENGTH=61 /DNA_ID=CAMNT_0048952287 /DNA_START=522 /DNA_END=703 /DNA_ORIENTATION=-
MPGAGRRQRPNRDSKDIDFWASMPGGLLPASGPCRSLSLPSPLAAATATSCSAIGRADMPG